MGETPAYCTDCHSKVVKAQSPDDRALLAAEAAGSVPMTKQGTCSKCGKTTVVLYYET